MPAEVNEGVSFEPRFKRANLDLPLLFSQPSSINGPFVRLFGWSGVRRYGAGLSKCFTVFWKDRLSPSYLLDATLPDDL